MNAPVICPCGAVLSAEPVDPDVAAVLRQAHDAVSPQCPEGFARLMADVLALGRPPQRLVERWMKDEGEQ